jgi:DNA-binding CsgD family transcriptional regulator
VLDASALVVDADPLLRAEAVRLRGMLERLRGNLARSFELLSVEAEQIQETEPALASELYLEAAFSLVVADSRRALEVTLDAISLDDQAAMPQVLAGALRLLLGEPGAPTAEDVEASVRELLSSRDPASIAEHLIFGPVWALWDIGQPERAIALLDDLIDRLSAAKAEGLLPVALSSRGQIEFAVGRWAESLRDGNETVRLADTTGLAYEAAVNLWWLAQLEASIGLEAECRRHIARARIELPRFRVHYEHQLDAAARRLELTLDRPERALDYPIDDRERNFAGDWIEAAIRVGQTEEAKAALDDLERRRGSDAGVAPTVARLRGLLADDDGFEAWFERALAPVETPSHAPMSLFEHARTRLLLGERRRRAGRRVDARQPLSEALETFQTLDAKHWAARARRELNSTGTRVRSEKPGLDELTAQELAVARAVAAGATNREVAQALFLSVKTVEFHLANVFRKLDVRSRSELTLRIGRATAA